MGSESPRIALERGGDLRAINPNFKKKLCRSLKHFEKGESGYENGRSDPWNWEGG